MNNDLLLQFHEFESPQINGPIWVCGHDGKEEFSTLTHRVDSAFYSGIKFNTRFLLFRGTSLDRLPFALKAGVTGENPNEGFWGNISLSKAMEYGELILVYDRNQTKESWNEFELKNLNDEDLRRLRHEYNTEEIAQDGSRIFFSMFSPERRGRVHYEREHGYYVPGNPKQALIGLILLGNGKDWFQNLILKYYIAGGELTSNGKPLVDRDIFLNVSKEPKILSK